MNGDKEFLDMLTGFACLFPLVWGGLTVAVVAVKESVKRRSARARREKAVYKSPFRKAG